MIIRVLGYSDAQALFDYFNGQVLRGQSYKQAQCMAYAKG